MDCARQEWLRAWTQRLQDAAHPKDPTHMRCHLLRSLMPRTDAGVQCAVSHQSQTSCRKMAGMSRGRVAIAIRLSKTDLMDHNGRCCNGTNMFPTPNRDLHMHQYPAGRQSGSEVLILEGILEHRDPRIMGESHHAHSLHPGACSDPIVPGN